MTGWRKARLQEMARMEGRRNGYETSSELWQEKLRHGSK